MQNDNEDLSIELKDVNSDDSSTGIIIMPILTPVDTTQYETPIMSHSSGSESSNERTSLKSQLDGSTISFYGVYQTPEETIETITELSGVDADESLTRAAYCGAFWKSIGAETIIYMSSFGGTMIANGLLIRFAGFNTLASTLIFGGIAVTSLPNTRILFSSLIKPAKSEVPEESKRCFEALDRYAFMPVSWMVKAATAGTTLALLGDSSFATQQVVGALTSTLIGPVTLGLRETARTCLKGSITIDPEYPSVGDAFKKAYSSEPNPRDNNRSYRWGNSRDIFNRALIISGATVGLVLSNGLAIQTYCIGGRDQLDAILQNNGTITNDDINTYCAGGSLTYLFRELGYTFAYSAGMMVLEPVLNLAFNKIYDFFYPAEESDSTQESNDNGDV